MNTVGIAGYAPSNPSQLTQPSTQGVNGLIVEALSRLAQLVQRTDNMAYALRGPIAVNAAPCPQAPTQSEPSLTDKVRGIHQLITLLENNVADIGNSIG